MRTEIQAAKLEIGLLGWRGTMVARLFTASEAIDDERVLGLVEQCTTTSMNEELLKPFTEEDTWHAVQKMTPLKALMIDNFPTLFYQRYWHIVGPHISQYCFSILKGEIKMGDINKTHIILILKVKKMKNITQFRPISLCNVIYKIIAKVLIERMSGLLGYCIDEA
ncbi:reverse transcriptase [Gossypium australe]|uniref:Reverse transcriptase n=1 Tax=Gossypium australe TaxID=47621 RepID=A0A5B6VX01_9ROSI|nr:reverse transcriptase [Gossypium australe]